MRQSRVGQQGPLEFDRGALRLAEKAGVFDGHRSQVGRRPGDQQVALGEGAGRPGDEDGTKDMVVDAQGYREPAFVEGRSAAQYGTRRVRGQQLGVTRHGGPLHARPAAGLASPAAAGPRRPVVAGQSRTELTTSRQVVLSSSVVPIRSAASAMCSRSAAVRLSTTRPTRRHMRTGAPVGQDGGDERGRGRRSARPGG